MKKLFSQDWNKDIAINEMVGSFFLCLFVFISFYSVKKYKDTISIITQRLLLSLLFCISVLSAILITKSFAYHMGDESDGIALLNPGFVIMYAIKLQTYSAIWYLITFQIFGSIFAFLVYILFLVFNKETNIKQYLFQSNGSKIQYTFKEFLFVTLLYIFIGLITTLGPGYNAGIEAINLFSVVVALFILFFTSARYNFFNFSFAIQLVNWAFLVLANLFSDFQNYNSSLANIKTQSIYNLISFITYFGGAISVGLLLQLMATKGGGYV